MPPWSKKHIRPDWRARPPSMRVFTGAVRLCEPRPAGGRGGRESRGAVARGAPTPSRVCCHALSRPLLITDLGYGGRSRGLCLTLFYDFN